MRGGSRPSTPYESELPPAEDGYEQPLLRRFRIGTSGWVYRDWREHVYPRRLPQRAWLHHLSRRFSSIEINASFYRLPAPETFERWAGQVPAEFVFSVKMSRYLTHLRRFRDPGEPLHRFWEGASRLGPALGPVLFQQPPTFACDIGALRALLHALPVGMQAAFEFRHESWHRDDVLAALDDAGAAWVIAHRPHARPALDVTGGWSYVRFHQGTLLGPAYPAPTLRRWSKKLSNLAARQVFVYFNNDPGGAAVRDAELMQRYLDARWEARTPDVT
jgi:uncharacterized protein YecE (DUF72 family)